MSREARFDYAAIPARPRGASWSIYCAVSRPINYIWKITPGLIVDRRAG